MVSGCGPVLSCMCMCTQLVKELLHSAYKLTRKFRDVANVKVTFFQQDCFLCEPL